MARSRRKSPRGSLIETVKTIVFALVLAGLIRTLLFQPFWIPSGSMKENLLIGDFLFVNKYAYGYSYASCPTMFGVDFCGFARGSEGRLFGSEPARGDIVVFKHPVTGVDFIKRLIGLPGDVIRIEEGVIWLNGEPATLEPAGQFVETYDSQGPLGSRPICANAPVGIGGECIKERFVETLPDGTSHTILETRRTSTDNVDEFVVDEGHYFFMGDNRDNSIDSRVSQAARGVGLVPRENIIGRADRVMFSSAGSFILAFWTWRSDRFFKAIE